jgi:hypothetical protein
MLEETVELYRESQEEDEVSFVANCTFVDGESVVTIGGVDLDTGEVSSIPVVLNLEHIEVLLALLSQVYQKNREQK